MTEETFLWELTKDLTANCPNHVFIQKRNTCGNIVDMVKTYARFTTTDQHRMCDHVGDIKVDFQTNSIWFYGALPGRKAIEKFNLIEIKLML